MLKLIQMGFRPLSREIGSYTVYTFRLSDKLPFPAPLEGDRYLYKKKIFKLLTVATFPAPFEVDRELYETRVVDDTNEISFRPLSR